MCLNPTTQIPHCTLVMQPSFVTYCARTIFYAGYVFLVDGIERIRWTGSGEGTEEEVQSMIAFAQEFTKSLPRDQKQLPQSAPRVGKKVH
mmetsp:Transcript_23606/g.34802  ORF Transcript_23606/g.34802 Transcript_23606/m.34802 type:complete len:90 (-) Transcript_23606:348-617(-)